MEPEIVTHNSRGGFHNEQQVEDYIRALDHERGGYEFHLARCKRDEDEAGVRRYERRIAEVDEAQAEAKTLLAEWNPGEHPAEEGSLLQRTGRLKRETKMIDRDAGRQG